MAVTVDNEVPSNSRKLHTINVKANIKMKILTIILTLTFLTLTTKGQYSFEKYPAIKYSKKKNWTEYDKREKENKMHWTISLPKFYKDNDSLTIQLTTFGYKDTSNIRIFKNKKQIQLLVEPYAIGRNFGMLIDTIYFADINGDSLLDLKILCWYGGCGIASLNERIIYLFQQPDNKFIKVSYIDMAPSQRPERDFDGDGNYEIITMRLEGYENHNYWTFNLYNFKNGNLECVNDKYDYPIMIQYLFKANYKITDKISKEKMKTFSKKLPDYFDKKY